MRVPLELHGAIATGGSFYGLDFSMATETSGSR